MEKLKQLYHYLRDPHLVARFQKICGVRGTFSRAGTETSGCSSGSQAAADRTHTHNNGACHQHGPGDGESAVGSGRDGGKVQTRAAGARKRKTDCQAAKTPTEGSETSPQNGAAVSAATAWGDSGAGPNPRRSSAVKPLRKNSLTGDAGQEFLIENRFLFYLFTFGTELGNELFYITFFPFVMWNVDAFVSRRLIMVWVWVMYLGQCTKDVIGWSRPASPPVVKVEMFYNSEYSMPSTHAMSGTAIPFSLFFMTLGRWEVK